MEGACKSSKFEPEDFISGMPDIVVTNILNRLPLQEAVRTGILAKNWRLKWTMLSQLVLDKNFYNYLLRRKAEKNYGTIISRLLLHLKGVITKFVIYAGRRILNDEDINHLLLFLCRNGIKDLTLYNDQKAPLELPIHLFSCMELKRLVLTGCRFDPPTSFHGFPSLLSLELYNVRLKNGKFGQFFTHCPTLETLDMDFTNSPGKVKLVEIAKLKNLKILSLSLYNLDNPKIRSSIIFELAGCLPQLQELHLDFWYTEFIVDVAKRGLPVTFPCVKTLSISRINVGTGMNSLCALEIISSFPNLQSFEIRETKWLFLQNIVPTTGVHLPEVDYSTTGLLQLRSVVLGVVIGSDDELCLIEHVLARSPFLKKIVIHYHSEYDEPLFARKLLKLHRASPLAEIDLVDGGMKLNRLLESSGDNFDDD
ncbi:hypothetical protein SSX86_027795 [Deinandra increscens subsp. villosa]|uniref:F-box/LRR-repeat protein 15/At3g58940/PEG3-like LRR domain-containing protein n=1 Tax=Deinandra increscens subsp. villosa TaxID=3103831 RepID=A0AAP0C6H5_9ASTR